MSSPRLAIWGGGGGGGGRVVVWLLFQPASSQTGAHLGKPESTVGLIVLLIRTRAKLY